MNLDETIGHFQSWILAQIQKKRPFSYPLRLIAHTLMEFNALPGFEKAGALAYITILSLFPITVLFVLYAKIAGRLELLSMGIQDWIFRTFVAEAAQGVVHFLEQSISNFHTRTLGVIGVGGLIFTVYSLLRIIEKTFNHVWKVPRHRSVWVQLQMLCTILVVVPTLLVASFYASGKIQRLDLFFHGPLENLVSTKKLLLVLPFFLTSVSLFFFFKLIPNTHVRWKPALVAAIFSALLFETAKYFFTWYVVSVIPVHKMYGSLGLIPIFLLWVFFSWVVILWGAELSFVIQNLDLLHQETFFSVSLPTHEDWGQQIFRCLIKNFSSFQGPVSIEIIAKEIGLPLSIVHHHLDLLKKAGIVAKIEEEEAFLPSQPLEDLTSQKVAEVFRRYLKLP